MSKAYMIVYDKEGLLDFFDYSKFHKKLTQSSGIISWWHYLNNVYIIKVDKEITANGVANYIRKIMPNRNFIAIEVDLANHDGWLPSKAWDWINSNK